MDSLNIDHLTKLTTRNVVIWTNFFLLSVVLALTTFCVYWIRKYRNQEFVRIRGATHSLGVIIIPCVMIVFLVPLTILDIVYPFISLENESFAGYLLTAQSVSFYFFGVVETFAGIPVYAKQKLSSFVYHSIVDT